MPAAAVIPAPIAYIKAVEVKKLVVGSRARACGPPRVVTARSPVVDTPCPRLTGDALNCGVAGGRKVYFEKIRVFKAGPSKRRLKYGVDVPG